MVFILIALFSYLIGSLHGSSLAKKLSGVNIKESGVKNSGASNATLVLGWKYGLLVAAFDILKAVFAVLIVTFFVSGEPFLLFCTAFFVIAGHIFPVFLSFQGGKGTASAIGALLAIDWKIGLLAGVLFILVSVISDYIFYGVVAFYLIYFGYSLSITTSIRMIILCLSLLLLVAMKHSDNIQRLADRSEPRLSNVWKKKRTC
ncbi:glycerol-3-phosphate acyltransferase [Paenisporosarcina cavernae]|uniref:Glycerol-3-phosphate acyltransferase n=1 Tax=Paenisporosarcina cavernae TaxID=2320858 RepID=A0A385YPW3_9BACL|nr:glycerol-3-phosphate acyltransferase [Paenisporosarcina cavernae]AYC28646.1 glycerol-3-phosphate acyltransferase [Paenisporosarcina cavernae]